MKESKSFIAKQIKTLVPEYESLQVKVKVNSTSYSVVFSAVISGKEKQCFEMIDEGLFTENDFDKVAKTIADYYRSLPSFDENKLNKYTVFLR